MIQTMRVTEDMFLPDSDLRVLLKLDPTDIILSVERHRQGFYLKGASKDQAIDLQGCVVTVYRGEKRHELGPGCI